MKYTGRLVAVSLVIVLSVIETLAIYSVHQIVPVTDFLDILVYGPLAWFIGRFYDQHVYRTKERRRQEFESREKLFQESQYRYSLLFNNITDALLIFDMNGNLLDGNPAVEKISGWSVEELKEIGCLSVMVPEVLETKMEHIKRVLNGQEQEFETAIYHKNGATIHVYSKIHPLIIDNEMVGLFEIIRDITESKQMAARIIESEKLSVAGQLAAGIAHEIRNPLTTIKGFVQLYKDKMENSYINLILMELDRINFIVSEFLVLSKPQAVLFKRTDFRNALQHITSFMQAEMNMKNIQLLSDIPAQTPWVKGEENQLKQVFVNLLKNAMESMAQGGTIHLQLTSDANRLTVLIRDEGSGMPEDVVNRLGEPFYTTKEGGTGLGLMVSKMIIENHGGEISFHSVIGKGTSVYVSLPRDEPGDEEVAFDVKSDVSV